MEKILEMFKYKSKNYKIIIINCSMDSPGRYLLKGVYGQYRNKTTPTFYKKVILSTPSIEQLANRVKTAIKKGNLS